MEIHRYDCIEMKSLCHNYKDDFKFKLFCIHLFMTLTISYLTPHLDLLDTQVAGLHHGRTTNVYLPVTIHEFILVFNVEM